MSMVENVRVVSSRRVPWYVTQSNSHREYMLVLHNVYPQYSSIHITTVLEQWLLFWVEEYESDSAVQVYCQLFR